MSEHIGTKEEYRSLCQAWMVNVVSGKDAESLKADLLSQDRERVLSALARLDEILRTKEGGAEYLQVLIPLLDDANAEIRRAATWCVGKLGQNKSIDRAPLAKLNSLLSDKDQDTRENAAWALGELAGSRIGRRESIPLLNILLRDNSAQIRGMAAWALGRFAERMLIGQRSSVEILESLLQDKSLYARKSAAWALERLSAIDLA